MNKNNRTLEVLFPLSALRAGNKIIDPFNIESIFEYYLLENLGVGLIRDDLSQPDGYAPLLASSWEKLNDSTWMFIIRPDLKWSDGSKITGEQLVRHFISLKKNNSRHLLYLKMLENVKFDQSTNALFLRFSQKVDRELLHELSLADAVLTYPDATDWCITSGPYFIKQYLPSEKELFLENNVNSPIKRPNSPKHVHLFSLKKMSDLNEIFSKINVDLFYLPPSTFRSIYSAAIKNAPFLQRGQKTLIHFLSFNEKHPLFGDSLVRRELSFLIKEVFSKVNRTEFYEYYDQMIPKGYSGQLLDYNAQEVTHIVALSGKKIAIKFSPDIKEVPGIMDSFNIIEKKYKINFAVSFGDTEGSKIGEQEFARSYMFQGNQKDPLGSWSFLFSEKTGVLAPYKDGFLEFFLKIAGNDSSENRLKVLHDLHEWVLQTTQVIPFLVESPLVLTSKQVDISRWNQFDFRIRLYEVKWK